MPSTVVMSFVMPDEATRQRSLRQVFCAHVNFYSSPAAAARWSAATDNGKVLELATAGALARRRNPAAFGDVLPVSVGLQENR